MYLTKAFQGKNHFWRYLVTLIIVFGATQIGGLPYTIILAVKSLETGQLPDVSNIADFSLFGIDPNLGLFLMILPFITGLVILLVLIKAFHQRTVLDTLTGRNLFDFNRFWVGVLTWLSLWVFLFLIHYIIEPDNFTLNFDPSKFFILLVVAILFIPFQSSFEEVLFRGYLMQGFAVLSKNRWIPILVTSLIFGLLHSFNPEVKEYGFALVMPQYIIFGLFFAMITILDDGLELALSVHAANNVFLSVFITHDASALQTPALFKLGEVHPLIDLIELVLVSLIFIFIVSKRYNWGNWKILIKKISV
jgi:membrane protease YdiL (CAAX protease family)